MLTDHHRVILLHVQDNLRRVQAFRDEALIFRNTLDYLKAYSAPGEAVRNLPARDRIHVVYEKVSHVVDLIHDDLKWLEDVIRNDVALLADAHLLKRETSAAPTWTQVTGTTRPHSAGLTAGQDAAPPGLATTWDRRLARRIRDAATEHLMVRLADEGSPRSWCLAQARRARAALGAYVTEKRALSPRGDFNVEESSADFLAIERLTVVEEALDAIAEAPFELDVPTVAARLTPFVVREIHSCVRQSKWDSLSLRFLDAIVCYPGDALPSDGSLMRLARACATARVRRRRVAGNRFSLELQGLLIPDAAPRLAERHRTWEAAVGTSGLPHDAPHTHPIDAWFFDTCRRATREIEAATRALRNVESGLGERLNALPPGAVRPPGLFPGKGEERVLRFVDELVLRYRDAAILLANNFVFCPSARLESCELETTAALVHEYAPDLVATKRWNGVPNAALINVPFWYTEVPRYLVNLAHELAHLVLQRNAEGYVAMLREPLDRFVADWLASAGSVFARGPAGYFPHQNIESILEVLADVFAIFVAGPYYPMSFFLTACGHLTNEPGIAPEEHANAVIRTSAMLAALEAIREVSGCEWDRCSAFGQDAVRALREIRVQYYEALGRRIESVRDARDRNLLSMKRNYLQVLDDVFASHAGKVAHELARTLRDWERAKRETLPLFFPRRLPQPQWWATGAVPGQPDLSEHLLPAAEINDYLFTSPGWVVRSERRADRGGRPRESAAQVLPNMLWDAAWRHVGGVVRQLAQPGGRAPRDVLFARVEEKKMLDRVVASHSWRSSDLDSLRVTSSWRACYYEALEAKGPSESRASSFLLGRFREIFGAEEKEESGADLSLQHPPAELFALGRAAAVASTESARRELEPDESGGLGYFAFSSLGFHDFLFLQQTTHAECQGGSEPHAKCRWTGRIDSTAPLGPEPKKGYLVPHYVVPRVYYEIAEDEIPGPPLRTRGSSAHGQLMLLVQARIKRTPHGELGVSEREALARLAKTAGTSLAIWKAFVAKGWDELVLLLSRRSDPQVGTLQEFCRAYEAQPEALKDAFAETYTSILICEGGRQGGREGRDARDASGGGGTGPGEVSEAERLPMRPIRLVTLGRYRRYVRDAAAGLDRAEAGLPRLVEDAPRVPGVRLVEASEVAGPVDVSVAWEVAGDCSDEAFVAGFSILLKYVVDRLGLHSISTHLVLRKEPSSW